MARALSRYHRERAAQNRTAILTAALELFLESGYDRTSLARIAKEAGVSKATLFKQFPTKAELFEATVLTAGSSTTPQMSEVTATPRTGDAAAGATELGLIDFGRAYARLLLRPDMERLIRVIVAEAPRFPELRERVFDLGTLPVIAALHDFLRAETEAGRMRCGDVTVAAPQFLGMISTVVFWPRLIQGGWEQTPGEVETVIAEAAQTFAARFVVAS